MDRSKPKRRERACRTAAFSDPFGPNRKVTEAKSISVGASENDWKLQSLSFVNFMIDLLSDIEPDEGIGSAPGKATHLVTK